MGALPLFLCNAYLHTEIAPKELKPEIEKIRSEVLHFNEMLPLFFRKKLLEIESTYCNYHFKVISPKYVKLLELK